MIVAAAILAFRSGLLVYGWPQIIQMCALFSARGTQALLALCGISSGVLHPFSEDKSLAGVAVEGYSAEKIMPIQNPCCEQPSGTWQGGQRPARRYGWRWIIQSTVLSPWQ